MKFKDLDRSVRWAFYAMGFTFLILFIATGITIHIAVKDHEPIADPDYYEKGLNYEKAYQDIKVMKADGYQLVSPLFEDRFPFTSGDNRLEIEFKKGEEPITDGELTMLRERGATFKFNRKYKFDNLGDGKYATLVDIPDLGQWVFTVKATHDGRTLSKIVRIIVQK